MTDGAGGRTLFEAGMRPRRIWIMLAMTAVLGVGGVWYGADLLQTYGIRPADGGVLAPPGARIAWFVGVSVLGLSAFVGVLVYARCYVVRLGYDYAARALHLRTMLPPARVVSLGEILGGGFHHGRFQARSSVDAPWLTLRVCGRRMPYVIDVQGHMHDPAAIERLLNGRSPAGAPDR